MPEYSLNQDQLQIHGQLAADALIEAAFEDEVITRDVADKLRNYVLTIHTNRGFSERLRKLLGLQQYKDGDTKFQTVWIANRKP